LQSQLGCVSAGRWMAATKAPKFAHSTGHRADVGCLAVGSYVHYVEGSRELPMEYSVELNRLIQLEMEGSVG
jgi:hypothetical protein